MYALAPDTVRNNKAKDRVVFWAAEASPVLDDALISSSPAHQSTPAAPKSFRALSSLYHLEPYKIVALTLCFVGCACADASLVESTPTGPPVLNHGDMTQADEGPEMRSSAVDMRADDAEMSLSEDMRQSSSPMDLGPDLVEDMSAPPVPARCAGSPRVCQDPGAVEHQIKPLDGCAFGLTLESVLPQARHDELARRGRGQVALSELVLNREGLAGVTAQTAERLKNHAYVGFRWNSGDMATTAWYPQGITGEQDSAATPTSPRRLLVSWYDRSDAQRGARLSVVALGAGGVPRYRHLLLVEPQGSGDTVSFKPARTGSGTSLHAGGIVWLGDKLYVADTTQGFRVFDLSQIIEVTHTDDLSRIGVTGSRMDAYGYRYIVPQVARYRLAASSCPARFSFVGLDRRGAQPLLISGEYRADDPGGRLMRWPVDDATGWLKPDGQGDVVRALDAFVGAQTRIQGALSWGSTLYMSSSSQTPSRYGRLYRAKLGQTSHITAWVYGAEDLYHERSLGLIWTPAEHPDARDVVAIPRQEY